MNIIKKHILKTLTIKELVEYFHSKGIRFSLTLEKKQQPKYYAKDSRLYKTCNISQKGVK